MMSIKKWMIAGVIATLALVPATAHAADGEAGWGKGAYFKSDDGRFSLNLGSRVQVRYTQDDPEDGDSVGSFRIRRAKFAMSGNVYGNIEYKIQAVWSGGSTTLEDAYFVYTGNEMAQFWVGQGKAFFGRQELTSSGKQQFVDRSIASERFAHGRDQGIALIGENSGKTFEYNLGFYNGNGRNRSSDDNDEKLLVGRVVFTPFGQYKLEESSLDYPDSPKLAIGASFLTNTEDAGPDEVDIDRFGVEFAFKVGGFNSVAEYYSESADLGAGDADTDGFYAQLGYLFPNKQFEIAGRYAVVSPDSVVDADETETGIAASYYISKHNYKIQADFLNIEDEFDNTDDRQIRVQLQIAF
jgi:phosphate-selective porin